VTSIHPYPAARRRRDAGRWARRPIVRFVAGVATLAAVAMATAAPATAASTAAGPRYFVATNAASGAGKSCATAKYATIQSAVTAAEAVKTGTSPAPRIEVCPGTYYEQVTITRGVRLERAHVPAIQGAAVVELPTSPVNSQTNCQAKDSAGQLPQSVIEICAAKAGGVNTADVSVSISHITVQGNWGSVCNNNLYDVLVEGGATLSLTDSVVEQAGAFPLNGCQGGVGVQVGYAPTGQVGHARLSYDTIGGYQKNGVTIDGSGSTARIADVSVTGAGPTSQIAQNGIQISFGATGAITGSIITGNNYTGAGEASADGILVYGGGGAVCGTGKHSALSRKVRIVGNTLVNNDIGVQLFNVNKTCNASPTVPTDEVACSNKIVNYNGYTGGIASADANVSGFGPTRHGIVGDQAGVSDSGRGDKICDNAVSGPGYAPRDKTRALPNPPAPAWVRPVDIFSFATAIKPYVRGNTYDGKKYTPR
jgi:hypothetical protein